uniref:Uncharacterized protein n=1 Tax=Anguilla anguilla TaxID=7936 RepID=A0A0E9S9Z2_ANGAN
MAPKKRPRALRLWDSNARLNKPLFPDRSACSRAHSLGLGISSDTYFFCF